ncbi:MAG: hypothetical protein ABIT83_14440 [Massilia sp.]
MNPIFVLSRSLLACLLAAAALTAAAEPEPTLAPPVARVANLRNTTPPYSLKEVIETEQVLHDGNVIARKRFVVSIRDSAGNTRREELNGNGGVESISISLVQGVRYALDPVAKTATTSATYVGRQIVSITSTPRPPAASTEITAPAGGVQEIHVRVAEATPNPQLARIAADAFADRRPTRVTVRSPLGSRVINGEQCSGTLISYDIAAGEQGNRQAMTITTETWMSDGLQISLFTRTTDPRYGTTTTRSTELVRGEPDPALFTVPSDYVLIDKARPAAM